MKRRTRHPSKFSAIDFADQIGLEFNLPLNRLSEKFSFEDATRAAIGNRSLMYGRRVERMFEYVIASLGHANLITAEDSVAPLYLGNEVQAPDYFVSLKSEDKYFVEVKSSSSISLTTPVTFGKAYLSRLKQYAALKGHPLLLAIYWNNLRIWTINKVEDFETENGTINLRFPSALQRSISGSFGDRMVAAIPPLLCRIHADPNQPSLIVEENLALFTINALSFYSEGQEVHNEFERKIAFYLIFHSNWESELPVANVSNGRIDYVEISARAPLSEDVTQPFESLGTLAGMISSYYKWLTTANEEVVRLTPQLEPAELAPGFDDAYIGEVLRLWQFKIEPNYEPLIIGESGP